MRLQRLLDSLDSSGGHLLILLVLVLAGLWHSLNGSSDFLAGAFGALLLALKSNRTS